MSAFDCLALRQSAGLYMLFLLRNAARPLSLPARRAFHLTRYHRTSENKEVFFKAFQHTSLFSKLANHPSAVTALEDFAKLLQEKGESSSQGS
jgi:hypothetical protein